MATAAPSTQTAAAAPGAIAPGPIYVDTQHEDLVHDAQMDYYGAKLATCSSGKLCVLFQCGYD
jgi:protein transport protein SEC13